jgi:malonyl-CoA decarboxylase
VLDILKEGKWHATPGVENALRLPLLRACALYLHARDGHRTYDPVARFHLGNGARIERLHWLADTSPKGLRQSAGVMVSYLYDLADIESNHERFVRNGRVVTSREIRRLMKT